MPTIDHTFTHRPNYDEVPNTPRWGESATRSADRWAEADPPANTRIRGAAGIILVLIAAVIVGALVLMYLY